MPWYLSFIFYMGRGPAPLCPLFYNPPWGLFALFSFLFDTIFYAAFAMAGNEFYRWAKRQNILTGDPKTRLKHARNEQFPLGKGNFLRENCSGRGVGVYAPDKRKRKKTHAGQLPRQT